MTSRPAWDGFLRFSLISVPVKAFTAAAGGQNDIGFNLLHKGCNSRIRYKKVCPIHGEVEQREIVSGYEYSKGKYVVLEPEELSKLKSDGEQSINIDAFVDAEDIDPIYFAGRTYFLLPSGKVAEKSYAVLQETLKSLQRFGVAEIVLSGREHLAVVRSCGSVMLLTLLNYVDEVKKASDFEAELSAQKLTAEEKRLAKMLVESSTRKKFDLAAYQDDYAAKVQKLIDAKVKGKRIVAPPTQEAPAVINLMDALRKSIDQTERPAKRERPAKARRRQAKKSIARQPAAKRSRAV